MTIFRYPMLCWRFWQSVHSGYASKDQKNRQIACFFFVRRCIHIIRAAKEENVMSMWRQYIVLRDQSGRTAQGFVKLFYTHQACNVSASLSRIQRGSYTLYIWDGDRLRQWEMRHNGRELRLQVKTALQNTRIEAAIVDQGGQLVALGESCDPRAERGKGQRASTDGPSIRIPARAFPKGRKTAGKPSRRPIGRNAQYRVHFPAFSGGRRERNA